MSGCIVKRSIVVLMVLGVFLAAQEAVWAQGPLREKLRERILSRRAQGAAQTSNPRSVAPPGDYTLTITSGGRERSYILHVPPSYDPNVPAPLVMAFHGGGGSARIMAEDRFYGWITKSDREGFLAVFPNGASRFPSGKLATWNAGNCCAYARDNDIDDVGFVRDMLADLKARLNIDRRRVFATGMSNGGMMAYRLACEMSGELRAVAAVAGTDNFDACRPEYPVSVLHIHAQDDTHVLFNGGAGSDVFKDQSKVTDFTSVPETVSRWVERDNCAAIPRRVLDDPGVYCERYSGCDQGSEVELCVTETGGHSWPGAKATPRSKKAPPSKALVAVDVIWDFFQRQN